MPAAPRNILAIRMSSIGDIVHALPAVAALGEALPGAAIDWAVERRYAALLAGNPCVRRAIEVDTLAWKAKKGRLNAAGEMARECAQGAAALRKERYDAVIDFQGLIKTAAMAWLCRAPRRIGRGQSMRREPGAGWFYTETAEINGRMHVIQENMALAERLTGKYRGESLGGAGWRFPLPRKPEDERGAEAKLAGAGEFILISPGGGWMAKRWPPGNYAQLIARMSERRAFDNLSVVLTGSPDEEAWIRGIARDSASERARFVPATLGEYIALARRARLFLGGDTGPMHLAAALGTPVAAIMGPTDPARNGPFSPEDVVLWNREPVNHSRRARHYLEGIAVDEALSALERRLGRRTRRDAR